LGYRVWPGILLGAILANVTYPSLAGAANGPLLAASLGIAIGNTAEALVAGWLVKRFANGREAFNQPQTVFRFLALAAVLSTALSATRGLGSLFLAGFQPPQFWRAWGACGFGDMACVILLTAWLIRWSNKPLLSL